MDTIGIGRGQIALIGGHFKLVVNSPYFPLQLSPNGAVSTYWASFRRSIPISKHWPQSLWMLEKIMPIPTYYKEIIGAIQTATDEGRVNWMRDEGHILVSMAEAFLSLSSGIDAFRHTRYVSFGLKDLKNKASDGWAVDEGDEDYNTMYALMMSGRKAASGVGPRLDEIKEIFLHSPSIGKEDTARKNRNERYGT